MSVRASPAQPVRTVADRSLERGLTLLELLVVLAILAALAGTAFRATEDLQLEARDRSTVQTLDELRDAVLGTAYQSEEDHWTGFVADMGRRPRTTLETLDEGGVTRSVLSLSELWLDPGPAAGWAVRPALPVHGVPLALSDAEVFVACGWRGPYLRLPSGSPTLRDGHGVALVNQFGSGWGGATPDHLFGLGSIALRNPDQDVFEVRSTGSGDGSVYDRERAALFLETELAANVHVTVTVEQGADGSGGLSRDDAVPDPGDTITVRLYGPDPERPGMITVQTLSLAFDAPSKSFRFGPVLAGPRVLRAYFDDNGGTGTTSSYDASEVHELRVRPGLNVVPLRIDRNQR